MPQAPCAGNFTISPHNLLISIGLAGEQGSLAQGHSRQAGMLPYLGPFVQLFTNEACHIHVTSVTPVPLAQPGG